jgi:hypothetical protein
MPVFLFELTEKELAFFKGLSLDEKFFMIAKAIG